MIRQFFMVLAILLIAVSTAQAAQVTLAWDPNTEKDLAGYRIYMSGTSARYDKAAQKAADIPAGTEQVTIDVQPEDGRTVYFVATAYDQAGNESGFSNEISWTVPDHQAPAEPSMLKILERIASALESIAGSMRGGLRAQ